MYRILLRNSTSMMWISCTDIPETSAHVLFVYVLSSRTTHVSSNHPKFESQLLTLIAQHQSHRKEAEFTAQFALDSRIQSLQPMDEHQRQEDHILRDLSC